MGNELTAAQTFLKKSIARGQGNEDSEDEDDEPANEELSNTQLKAVTAVDATIPNKRGSFSECCTYNEKYHVEVDQDWTEKQLRTATASTTDNTQEEGSKSTHKGQRKGSLIRRLLKKKKSRRHGNDDGENDANEQCTMNDFEQQQEEEEGWTEEQLEAMKPKGSARQARKGSLTCTYTGQYTHNEQEQPEEEEEDGWTEEQLEALASGQCTTNDFEQQGR